MKVKVKKGEIFYATIRRGPHSITLGGEEAAGRTIGPIVASRNSTSLGVSSGDIHFNQIDFKVEKANGLQT